MPCFCCLRIAGGPLRPRGPRPLCAVAVPIFFAFMFALGWSRAVAHASRFSISSAVRFANGTITNQSGGPHEKFRIRVEAGVAYGSDIDRVRALLVEISEQSPWIIDRPKAQVRFTTMGDSALIFALNAWVEEPGKKESAIDDLNTRIYKALVAEGFEIPYPKTDVYLYPQS